MHISQRDLELQKKYPKILQNLGGNPNETCMSVMHGGIDIGDGWIPILDMLFEFCQFNHDENGYPQLVADQIKEKFGSLRLYYHFEECDSKNADLGVQWNRDEKMLDGACRFAELMTQTICEICGNPAVMSTGNWRFVRCKECTKTINT